MFISKKESIDELTARLSKNEYSEKLKGHRLLVAHETLHDAAYYGVYRINRSGKGVIEEFPFEGYFSNLKTAIEYSTRLENPTMINEGYTLVKLHDELAIAIYYDHYEPDLENNPNIRHMIDSMGFDLGEDAYNLGGTGVSVCLASKADTAVNHEADLMTKFESMCAESLCPETHDMWEKVRGELVERRKNLKGYKIEMPDSFND